MGLGSVRAGGVTVVYREEQLYLSVASQPLRDVALLILDTGMRPEEVYRISRENVQSHDGYLFIPFGKTLLIG
jgi:integrase